MKEEYKYLEQDNLHNNLGFIFYSSLGYTRNRCQTGNAQYDEAYNNYKAKVVQTLKFKMPEDNNILNYVITVPFDWKTNTAPYLRGLTTQGSINLDLLNSGKSQLTGWKFSNSDSEKYTTLNYFFELYPKPGKNFSDLTLKFIDVSTGNQVGTYINHGAINNGSTTVTIDWDNVGLENQKLYNVRLLYTDCDGEVVEPGYKLWILTTDLFNDCYNTVSNYCFPKSGKESEIISNKCKIKLKVNGDISISNNVSYSTDGNFISNQESIDFTSIQTNTISIDSDRLKLEIENQSSYPDYINVDESSTIIKAKLNSTSEELFEEAYHDLQCPFNDSSIADYLYAEDTEEGVNIISKERITGTGIQGNFTNVFVKMSEALPQILEKTTKYCGLFPDRDHDSDPEAALIFLESSTDSNGAHDFSQPIEDNYSNASLTWIKTEENLSGYLVSWNREHLLNDRPLYLDNFIIDVDEESKYYSNPLELIDYEKIVDEEFGTVKTLVLMNDINDKFNIIIDNNNQMCTWLFANNAYSNKYIFNDNENAANDTILWWKSTSRSNQNIYWRASENLIKKQHLNSKNKNDIEKLVNRLFGKDFYFCFIKNQGSGSIELYTPDPNSKNKLTLNNDITINLPIKLSVKGGLKELDLPVTPNLEFEYYISETDKKVQTVTISHQNYGLDQMLRSTTGQDLVDIQGRNTDSMGNKLNSQNIYIEENGKLKSVSNNPFIISDSDTIDVNGMACRCIYCNEDESYSGKIKSPIMGQSGSAKLTYDPENSTNLYFRNVPLIPHIPDE